MGNVLFVCQGNMVRSQIAEALFKKYKHSDATSAGILPATEHRDGKQLKDLALGEWITTLKEKEGIDISSNICKQVTPEMVTEADAVVVMADKVIWPPFLRERADAVIWEGVLDHGDIPAIIDEIEGLVLML